MKARIVNVNDGLGYPANDDKYIRPHLFKVVNMTPIEGMDGFFKTDCAARAEKDNDYVRDGFLVVSRGNVEVLK